MWLIPKTIHIYYRYIYRAIAESEIYKDTNFIERMISNKVYDDQEHT